MADGIDENEARPNRLCGVHKQARRAAAQGVDQWPIYVLWDTMETNVSGRSTDTDDGGLRRHCGLPAKTPRRRSRSHRLGSDVGHLLAEEFRRDQLPSNYRSPGRKGLQRD